MQKICEKQGFSHNNLCCWVKFCAVQPNQEILKQDVKN